MIYSLMRKHISMALVIYLGMMHSQSAAQQSCTPQWSSEFAGGDLNNKARAFAVFDDGTGSALYVAGDFNAAGGQSMYYIARWDDGGYQPLGTGLNGKVHALAVFDDGNGEALYVGGWFTTAGGQAAKSIARWDGKQWSALGSGMSGAVNALVVHDDGSGAALYAGGDFSVAGSVVANRISRWDGTQWTQLGAGFNSSVKSLAVYDDGSGPDLYAGGAFTVSGATPVSRIARWDGNQWSALDGGVSATVESMTVISDVTNSLVVGGQFTHADEEQVNYIAQWDGENWFAMDNGFDAPVLALAVFDDGLGFGPLLYAGGEFMTADGLPMNHLSQWDGQFWLPVNEGVDNSVMAMQTYDDGSGQHLFIGGVFVYMEEFTQLNFIVKWNGQRLIPLGNAMNRTIQAMTVFDDGNGPALYVGGEFTFVDGIEVNYIAKWDGYQWSAMGDGMAAGVEGDPWVYALIGFDDGSGPALYAGGYFEHADNAPADFIAKWENNQWVPLGSGLGLGITGLGTAWVYSLGVYDAGDGPMLYAGGDFTVAGNQPAKHIAMWDGSQWVAVGDGFNHFTLNMATWDDGLGAGEALYVSGVFTKAGTKTVNRIAKWDGSEWTALGNGVDGNSIYALHIFDDGTGEALYAAGSFTSIDGEPVNRVAKWDGIQWWPLGDGVNATIYSMTSFDDGSGPGLYVGGLFTVAGGQAINHIARWDGQQWLPVGDGVNNNVYGMTSFDPGCGEGPSLYAGGVFTVADGKPSQRFAKLAQCPHAAQPSNNGLTLFFDTRDTTSQSNIHGGAMGNEQWDNPIIPWSNEVGGGGRGAAQVRYVSPVIPAGTHIFGGVNASQQSTFLYMDVGDLTGEQDIISSIGLDINIEKVEGMMQLDPDEGISLTMFNAASDTGGGAMTDAWDIAEVNNVEVTGITGLNLARSPQYPNPQGLEPGGTYRLARLDISGGNRGSIPTSLGVYHARMVVNEFLITRTYDPACPTGTTPELPDFGYTDGIPEAADIPGINGANGGSQGTTSTEADLVIIVQPKGDLDSNGAIDISDITQFIDTFQTAPLGTLTVSETWLADIDGNNTVDITDITGFISNFQGWPLP